MLLKNIVILLQLLIVLQCQTFSTTSECPNLKTDLKSIRKRRHLAFPDGSTCAIVISLAKAFQTHSPSGWMMVMDLVTSFPLPDMEFISSQKRRKLHHSQKRDIWDKLKNTLYSQNMDGHSCLLRSICDAKMYLAPPGRSLVHDVLRAMFSAPLHEPEFVEEMGGMYDELEDPSFCDKVHDCPLSLLHFILAFNKRKY